MFTPSIRTFSFVTGILFLVNLSAVFAQNSQASRQEMEAEARTSFHKGDFRSAFSGFRDLMEIEPADPMHPYYAGICLVEMNQDLDDAIELLYGASKRGVPADVNYYLGMAYHRNYNFKAAEKYYGRYELEVSKQEAKANHTSHLMATTKSAAEICATYNPFEVLNVTFFNLLDSVQFSQVKMKGGQLQRKPAPYYAADEDPYGLTSLAFVPRNPARGDYIYYAGYGRNQKDGAQLFRIQKSTGNSWGKPQEIKRLNSQGNEILPYFDPIESDLYFASDGRMGVGGFDLYRTHYDADRDQWSEPVNLGFPVNSAMDEYLLLPGTDLGMVMFFSTRQGTDSSLAVYRVHLVEPKKKTEPDNSKMLREIAQLGGVAEDILAELDYIERAKKARLESSMASVAGSQSQNEQQALPDITPVSVLSESKLHARYRHILSQAMKHQAASDSIADLARNARHLVNDSDDPNDRWVWQKQILLWDKKASDEKEISDQLYAKLENERAAHAARVSSMIPDAIEVDTVMGDLTVYRYKTSEAKPKDSQPATKPFPDGIEMLDRSPYSAQNPIPMDVPIPRGTFYMIQLGSFSGEVEPASFGGISPIAGMHADAGSRVRYYAGKFRKYSDAAYALHMIKSRGYEDAFTVAWYNGNIVSIQEAKQLE